MSTEATVEVASPFEFLSPGFASEAPKVAPRKRIAQIESAFLQQAMARLPIAMKLLGYDKLRQGQDRAILSLFSKLDTICILPTSHGKSSIFIIPAICCKWRVLIFSPLVSLMKDQLESLQRSRLTAGQISSGQTAQENQMALLNWESNDVQFLFVAPERLESDQFLKSMLRFKPDMVVVDEAHCLSAFGDNFRPSYRKIGEFVSKINPKVVLALTATATPDIEIDIRQSLGIPEASRIVYLPARDNLKLKTIDGYNDGMMKAYLTNSKGPTIVYCATRKETERLYTLVRDSQDGGCLVYNGGMTANERESNQNLFMSNQVRIMFATNAFGLGVNKPDIRCIIHRDLPGSVEAITQEQGRAGRDGQEAHCILFVDSKSLNTARWMVKTSYPSDSTISAVFYRIKGLANPKTNTFQLTIEDLSNTIAIDSKSVGAALMILTASKIVERTNDDENPSRITILKSHEDPKYQKYLDLVRTVGIRQLDGCFEFPMSAYLRQGSLKPTGTDATLRKLDQEGYISYVRPFKGKTTKIIGDLKLLDFTRLGKRRDMAYKKLDLVQDYVHIPDAEKQQFLNQYFGVSV